MINHDHELLLDMKNITKKFPGVIALDNVSFSLRKQNVHALVGQNGAGKSTLINILTGAIPKDSGKIFLDGREVLIDSTTKAIELGIACIHQEMFVVPDLTVAENVFLGDMPTKGFLKIVDYKKLFQEADAIFKELGVEIDVKQPMRGLGIAEQQLVMIARALHIDSKIIIMDEPTASLDSDEVKNLFRIIKRLIDDGKSVIYISHFINEIFEIADYVTIFRNGKSVLNESIENLSEKKVIEEMLGYKVEGKKFNLNDRFGDEVLRVENLCRKRVVNSVSFSVRAGEVIGVAGHLGSGRTELVRTLFGADKKDRGNIYIENRKVEINSPVDAVKYGMALVPEERSQGVIPLFSVANNITLSDLKAIYDRFKLNFKSEHEIARNFIDKLKIKVSSHQQVVSTLSGGNQQKVIFAKWLHRKAKILLLDEPTKGIDIGAKLEILNMITELAKNGMAVILVSSEFSDLVNVCNRILVLRKGRIIKTLTGVASDSVLQAEVNCLGE